MAIIKGQSAAAVADRAMVLDLGDLEAQGERIRQKARDDAAAILNDARQEAALMTRGAAEKGHSEGYEKGLATGHAEGVAEGRQESIDRMRLELAALEANWIAAIQEWDSQRQELLLRAREDLLVLAFSLAEKVTHRQIQVDPACVQDQVQAALALVIRRTSLEMRMHPEDVPLIEPLLPDVNAKMESCDHVSIVPDESIGRGGCVLRTSGGEVDARIDTQLNRLAEALLPDTEAVEPTDTETTS